MNPHHVDEAPLPAAGDVRRWLTVNEAAAFLRVDARTIADAVARDELPAHHAPQGHFIDRAALLSLMRQPLGGSASFKAHRTR